MSEQNLQRNQTGPDDNTADDPLAELARIVAGEAAPAPAPPAVSNPQDAQNPAVEPAPVTRAEPAEIQNVQQEPPVPVTSPTNTIPAAEISPASSLEASLRSENMDLESQLMAELGGGAPAPSVHQATASAPVEAQSEIQPAAQQALVAQPEITELAPNPSPEPTQEPDFEAALEQQLLQSPAQAEPATNGFDLPAMQENTTPADPGSLGAVTLQPAVMQSEPVPATEIQMPAINEVNSEVSRNDDLDFGAAFDEELNEVQQATAVPGMMPSQATPLEMELSQEPEQAQFQQSQPAVQYVEQELEIEQHQNTEPVETALGASVDELDIEASFTDAFADEFTLELDAANSNRQPLDQGSDIPGFSIEDTATAPPATIQPDMQAAAQSVAQPAVHEQMADIQYAAANSTVISSPVAIEPMVQNDATPAQPVISAEQQLSLQHPVADPGAGQLEPEHYQDEPEAVLVPGRRNSGFRMAAIALGLAVVAGVGVVGYSYVGDAETPAEPQIVRADQSEFKVKPDDPGGKVIANVNEPVYDTMAGNKPEETNQENLIAANVEPINVEPVENANSPVKSAERLDSGDNSTVANSAIAVMQPRKVKTVTVRADGTIVASADNTFSNSATPVVDPNSLGGAISTGNIAIPSANPTNDSETTEVALVAPLANETTPAIIQQVTTPVAAPNPVATRSITPTNISRPYVVQISSQRSMEAAEATYQNLKRRFASILDGQPKEIREAKVEGKGTFYRVRIPVGSQNDAASFCGRYKSAGGSCFVTR